MSKRILKLAGTACLLAATAACGEDGVAIDPAVAPFVGTWDADSLTVTADDPPYTVANLLSIGSFWISVEPSGQYTATLEFYGPHVELGQLTVQSGTQMTLNPVGGPPAPSTYSFAQADSLILDGATEFDFNLDGTNEPAQAHFELTRR